MPLDRIFKKPLMQYCERFEWFEGLMFHVFMMLSNVIIDVTISDCARISDTVSVPSNDWTWKTFLYSHMLSSSEQNKMISIVSCSVLR